MFLARKIGTNRRTGVHTVETGEDRSLRNGPRRFALADAIVGTGCS